MKISGLSRIAERYVKALFDTAMAARALEPVEKDLKSLGAALEANEDFRQFLANPLPTRAQQAEAMAALLEKMQSHEITKQFIALLARHRRLEALSASAELFAEWAARERSEMKAELVAATRLKVPEVAMVNDSLSKAYGKKVTLSVRQDAALLGGIVVKVGGLELDGSLAGKLARLNNQLKAA